MADETKEEKQAHKEAHKVYKAGDKYVCGECGTEVTFKAKCPSCYADFNWTEIMANVRHG